MAAAALFVVAVLVTTLLDGTGQDDASLTGLPPVARRAGETVLPRPQQATRPDASPEVPLPLVVPDAAHEMQTLAGPDLPASPDAPASLIGRVVDGAGRPVAGAELVAQPRRGESPAVSTRSDPTGRFRFDELGSPLWALRASARGSRSVWITIELRADEMRDLGDLELLRHARLFGTVRYSDGSPAPQRGVVIEDAEGRISTRRGDERGAYAFDSVGPGTWRISLEDDSDAEPTTLLIGEDETIALDLALPAPALLRGTIVRGELPAPELLVRTPDDASGRPVQTTSDDDGLFELAVAPGRDIEVSVHAPSSRRVLATEVVPVVRSHERIELRFQLRGGELAGAVVWQDGTPVADVSVELHAALDLQHPVESVRTGADGRFLFRDLLPDRYVLWTRWALTADAPAPAALGPIDLGEGEVREDLRLRVTPGATLSGTVHEPGGELSLRDLSVQAERIDLLTDERGRLRDGMLGWNELPEGASQDDLDARIALESRATWDVVGAGRFVLHGLEPGDYVVTLHHGGRGYPALLSTPLSVYLAPGSETSIRLTLGL